MLDKFTHLFRFQAIVEEGSMHRAAARLNLTQPALTRSISILEQSFGRALLERHARGVRPTAFGERVLGNVQRMSRYWEIADRELGSDPAEERVVLRLGIGPAWRSGVLAPVLDELRRRHPKLLVEISALREGHALADLNEGRLDAVLGGTRVDNREHPNLISRDLTTLDIRISARENHPIFDLIESGAPDIERRLLDYPWIIYSEMALYADNSDHTFSDRYGREPDVWMKSSNLMTVLTTLQRTDSVCVLADLAIGGVSGPRVVAVPISLRRKNIPVGLIHRAELADWDLMREFHTLCQEHLGTLRSGQFN